MTNERTNKRKNERLFERSSRAELSMKMDAFGVMADAELTNVDWLDLFLQSSPLICGGDDDVIATTTTTSSASSSPADTDSALLNDTQLQCNGGIDSVTSSSSLSSSSSSSSSSPPDTSATVDSGISDCLSSSPEQQQLTPSPASALQVISTGADDARGAYCAYCSIAAKLTRTCTCAVTNDQRHY